MNKSILIVGAVVLFLLIATPGKAGSLSEADKDALAAISYLDRVDLPLGMRNNNPGNLRPDGVSNWQGLIGIDSKNNFLRFGAFAWGVRALIKQIRDADLGRHGIRSIRSLIEKYSPVNDNSRPIVESYIKYLISHTGFTAGNIPDTSKDTVKKLVTGIADHENGRSGVISNKMFEFSWLLSLT